MVQPLESLCLFEKTLAWFVVCLMTDWSICLFSSLSNFKDIIAKILAESQVDASSSVLAISQICVQSDFAVLGDGGWRFLNVCLFIELLLPGTLTVRSFMALCFLLSYLGTLRPSVGIEY